MQSIATKADKRSGFHVRPARGNDRIRIEGEFPKYKTDRKGNLVFGPDKKPIQIGTEIRVDWVQCSLPVCVRHGFRRSRPRKPKVPAHEVKIKITEKDWQRRGIPMPDGFLRFGRTPKDYQANARFLRDRAMGNLRRAGIWNFTRDDLQAEMQKIVNQR